LYSIGDFSKISGIPIYTLRYWEKEGLLVPEFINPDTGYRSYSSKQFYTIQKILVLKSEKFTTKEIRNIDSVFNMQKLLEKRDSLIKLKNHTEDAIHQLNYTINRLNTKLKLRNLDEQLFVTRKSIPGGLYITHRDTYKNIYELLKFFVEFYNEVWQGKPILTDPYECFAIYYQNGVEIEYINIDVECCIAIPKNFTSKKYEIKEFPKIETAVSCLHFGPHETVATTFLQLRDWISVNGYKMCDYPRQNILSNEDMPNISNYKFSRSDDSLVCEVSELIVPVTKA
jgi:DNA-binding transcriptional MerR regulator